MKQNEKRNETFTGSLLLNAKKLMSMAKFSTFKKFKCINRFRRITFQIIYLSNNVLKEMKNAAFNMLLIIIFLKF